MVMMMTMMTITIMVIITISSSIINMDINIGYIIFLSLYVFCFIFLFMLLSSSPLRASLFVSPGPKCFSFCCSPRESPADKALLTAEVEIECLRTRQSSLVARLREEIASGKTMFNSKYFELQYTGKGVCWPKWQSIYS